MGPILWITIVYISVTMLSSTVKALLPPCRQVVAPALCRRQFAAANINKCSSNNCDSISQRETGIKPKIIFILGGPGSGKGTQSEMLSTEFGMKHLSAGELLRAEQSRGTADGRIIDAYLADGKIVPVEISLGLLRQEIEQTKYNRYIIDGFPRNFDNLLGWSKLMNDMCIVELVVMLDCGEKEMQKRIISRGLTSGRGDDNLEALHKRFRTFKEDTLPVVDYFIEHQHNLVRINGDQPVSDVYADLKKAVLSIISDARIVH